MCVVSVGQVVILYVALEVGRVGGHWLENIHFPPTNWPPSTVNGTQIPDRYKDSPDFRLEEREWTAQKQEHYKEENRPYRLSPFYKQYYRWTRTWFRTKENPRYLGCYCTTVYKRLTVLAGCAVITSRHILTTATSTELVLANYRDRKHLHNILGAWYDHDADVYNSSLYMTPARIHYHPSHTGPHAVNLTHPLPFRFDLAVWAATYKFIGNWFTIVKAVICPRGGPHWFEHLSSTPRYWDMANVVGFQYVKAQRKIPMPWFRYVVRTRDTLYTCPKTEWGWYHCLHGAGEWSKYGVESGAAWHRQLENRYWLFDGLIGLNAFSMKLRSEHMTHYFTVLNTHPVLDFLYNSYMGRLPYEFLDYRFWNTQWRAPYPKPWAWIHHDYDFGAEHYKGVHPLPWY